MFKFKFLSILISLQGSLALGRLLSIPIALFFSPAIMLLVDLVSGFSFQATNVHIQKNQYFTTKKEPHLISYLNSFLDWGLRERLFYHLVLKTISSVITFEQNCHS